MDDVLVNGFLHRMDSRPFCGPTQPTIGPIPGLSCNPMAGKTKRPKFVSHELRARFGRNVERMMKQRLTGGHLDQALADRIGVSKSTVQRVRHGRTGVSIDLIAQFAMGLGCDPADLLRRHDE